MDLNENFKKTERKLTCLKCYFLKDVVVPKVSQVYFCEKSPSTIDGWKYQRTNFRWRDLNDEYKNLSTNRICRLFMNNSQLTHSPWFDLGPISHHLFHHTGDTSYVRSPFLSLLFVYSVISGVIKFDSIYGVFLFYHLHRQSPWYRSSSKNLFHILGVLTNPWRLEKVTWDTLSKKVWLIDNCPS